MAVNGLKLVALYANQTAGFLTEPAAVNCAIEWAGKSIMMALVDRRTGEGEATSLRLDKEPDERCTWTCTVLDWTAWSHWIQKDCTELTGSCLNYV